MIRCLSRRPWFALAPLLFLLATACRDEKSDISNYAAEKAFRCSSDTCLIEPFPSELQTIRQGVVVTIGNALEPSTVWIALDLNTRTLTRITKSPTENNNPYWQELARKSGTQIEIKRGPDGKRWKQLRQSVSLPMRDINLSIADANKLWETSSRENLLSSTTDNEQELTLLDGSDKWWIGGPGLLKGDAAVLATHLQELADGALQQR